MGLLFATSKTVGVLALISYTVAAFFFILAHDPLVGIWARCSLFLAATGIPDCVVILCHRSKMLKFGNPLKARYFARNLSHYRRAFIFQTILGFSICFPCNILVNVIMFDYFFSRIESYALLSIWVLAVVTSVDLLMIIQQSKEISSE